MQNRLKKKLQIGNLYGAYRIINSNIVLKPYIGRDGNNKYHKTILCKCTYCGKENYIIWTKLRQYKGETGCKSCANRRTQRWKGTGIGDLSGTYFTYLRKQAKNSKKEFNLTKEYLWDLFLKQESKCIFSGFPIILAKRLKERTKYIDFSKMTASLDRIDSSKGYIPGNVQWVHKVVNIMKNTLSNNDFIFICKKISENNDNLEPSITNMENLVVMKVQRLTLEESKTNNSDTSIQHPSDKGDDIV